MAARNSASQHRAKNRTARDASKSATRPATAAAPTSPASAAPISPTSTSVPRSRWRALDAFRGGAVIAMIAYHFAFDLVHFGWLHADFYDDARLIACRTAIVSSFLFVSGMSLALARAQDEPARHFWRRIAKIGSAALLVSIGSAAVFGDRFIWFGVLHAIVVMSVLARPLLPLRGWLVAIGAVVVAIGATVTSPIFDAAPLRWIGMMTYKPPTEDYVPLLPWFGVMLAGAGALSLIVAAPSLAQRIGAWREPRAPSSAGRRGRRSRLAWPEWLRWPRWLRWPEWLEWTGRHSLIIYLVHQPLLFGLMTLAAR